MADSSSFNINRREALKRVGFLLGGAVSAPVAFGFLNGASARPDINWKPAFFSEDQAETITITADIIIPATDTPSASEVGVPGFIEDMVYNVWDTDERDNFLDGLKFFRERALDDLRKDFIDASETLQKAFVNKRHRQVFEGEIEWDKRPFIWSFKELTITGYCTTEAGATKLLQYEAIPGQYKPCIGLEEAGGKTWATS